MQIDSTAADRFWTKVSKTDSCWLWKGTRTGKGYGIFTLGGKRKRAHQISYILSVGPIPDSLQLDHLCRNPTCVNPAHLEPVTSRENTIRGLRARFGRSSRKGIPLKSSCKHGHPYSGDNLLVVSTTGRRACRACMRMGVEKMRARLEAKIKKLRAEINSVLDCKSLGRIHGLFPDNSVRKLPDAVVCLDEQGQ